MLVVLVASILIVVENVIESQWIERRVEISLDSETLSCKILPFSFDFSQFFVAQSKARYDCSAYKIGISIISNHKRRVIDYRTSPQSLNDKFFSLTSAVIWHGNFNDSILNEEHFLSRLILFADKGTLVICLPLHPIN